MPTPTVVDAETPVGLPLSARFKQSFAYFTMTSRNPEILQHTIDSLRENPPGGADVETLCREVEQLLEEMRGDASWPQLTSTAADAAQWNKLLRAAGCACSRHWLTAPWIIAESYMYRRVRQAAEAAALADPAKPPDPFLSVKQKALAAGMPAIQALAEWMSGAGTTREDLSWLLKTATRANAGDLSQSAGQVPDPDELLAITQPADEAFIADQSETIWTVLQSGAGCVTVDMVCDNAGYELFADLCLAQLLTSLGATRVRFRLKAHPYYVSDATLDDLTYLLQQLTSGDAPAAARSLAEDWMGRLVTGGPWTATAEYFWTLPLTYDRMPKEDPMQSACLPMAPSLECWMHAEDALLCGGVPRRSERVRPQAGAPCRLPRGGHGETGWLPLSCAGRQGMGRRHALPLCRRVQRPTRAALSGTGEGGGELSPCDVTRVAQVATRLRCPP